MKYFGLGWGSEHGLDRCRHSLTSDTSEPLTSCKALLVALLGCGGATAGAGPAGTWPRAVDVDVYSLRPVLFVAGIHVRRPRQTYKNSTDDSDLCSVSLFQQKNNKQRELLDERVDENSGRWNA
jgi:hypothetical protein